MSGDLRTLAVQTRDVDVFATATSPAGHHRVFTDVEIDAGLIESGTRRAVAEALGNDARADLAAWVRLAKERGRSSRQIAALAGVSHTIVQQLIR